LARRLNSGAALVETQRGANLLDEVYDHAAAIAITLLTF
jgi:hypothetical protein